LSGTSLAGRLKEAVRPYYLRWLYFTLRPHRRPHSFRDCWNYPFQKLADSTPLPEPASGLPDLLFYPMTDWHTRTQRTQQLVRAFAALGFRSIFLNPHLGREFETTPLFDKEHRLAKLGDNIFELHVRLPREPVYHDRLLSSGEEDIIASAIRRILPPRATAIQILSLPVWSGVARRFRADSAFPIIYDCHDYLPGFDNIGREIIDAEQDVFRTADLVLFSSQALADRYGTSKNWRLVRNAVDARQFEPAGLAAPPVAGYLGALDSWFDVEAIEQSAAQHPHCRFVLAGFVEYEPVRRLAALPNVEFAGEVPYSQVPRLLAQFRVALIPFRITPLTLMTNPIKMYEYFSCGLPVVSTPIPEVQAMGNLVYTGATPADFARQVGCALQEEDPSRRARRREIALQENWTARAREISADFPALLEHARPG